jgi:adenylate cyclase
MPSGSASDLVAVKGKSKGIKVYELLGRSPFAAREAVKDYERALELYWKRDFLGAIGILEGHPTDPPCQVLLDRCRKMLEDPPPSDWDGIYVAMSK